MTDSAQFQRSAALTGADPALTQRLERLYEQVFRASSSAEESQRPGEWRASLLPILREWFNALKTAPPARRAAGLLAADRLLEAARTAGKIPGWPDDPNKQSGLQQLGAVFEMNVSTGDYVYTSNWEKQARELDPDGKGLLSKSLDSRTAAGVHFMVGDAYSDIVAIAGGESGGNGEYDPAEFQNEANSARQKLSHYCAGLSSG